MGQSSLDSLTSLIMKMFVVLALAAVAAAEPEADPQVVVSGSPLLRHFGYAYKKPVFSYNYPVNTYSYSPYTAFPAVHAIGKREADAEPEADPALLYHAGVSPLTSTYSGVVSPVAYTTGSHFYNPATYTVGSHVVSPLTTYSAVAPVTHKITSYNNPNHYTAESFGVVGPKYIAKNHGVQHVVKREADPYVAISPYTGLSYTGLPLSYTGVPATYGVPVVKNVMGSHAVALTPFGATHSSNVGVCTNNNGERVAC